MLERRVMTAGSYLSNVLFESIPQAYGERQFTE